MPIYEYRCDSCGFQKEFIQRMSDARLTDCPECGKSTLNKMVTAAGFQLKGSGWYATDFRGSGAPKSAEKPADGAKSGDAAPAASTSEKSPDKPAAKAAETKAAAPAAPAASTSSG